MQGRWTIRKIRSGVGFSSIDGPATGLGPGVPVVPCDDAAIERVAQWLAFRDSRCGQPDAATRWKLLVPHARMTFCEHAAEALRAAGETP